MISIIIPAYNHGAALPSCLASLRRQSFSDWEAIIVDDGSTDDTEQIVNNYTQSCRPEQCIRYFKLDHSGAPRARNAGAKLARGSYLLFADADLIFDQTALKKMFAALKNNPQAAYAYCSFKFGWKKFTGRTFNAAALRQNNYIHTSALIRRECFPGFDEQLKRFQDWDLWLTMLKGGHVGVFVPEILFQACVTRRGISAWRPRAWYYFWSLVVRLIGLAPASFHRYLEAKKIVQLKHGLI